jgi:hypothetical protein
MINILINLFTSYNDSLSCVMSINKAGATDGRKGRLFGNMNEPVGGPPYR